jgi:hypothetical protein
VSLRDLTGRGGEGVRQRLDLALLVAESKVDAHMASSQSSLMATKSSRIAHGQL